MIIQEEDGEEEGDVVCGGARRPSSAMLCAD